MSFTKVILLLTLSLLFSPILLKGQINETSFEFSLKESSQTSAGVYTSDTTLIRTLWSGINFSSGKHVAKWDGLSDDGSQAPKDNYHVKVLSHNVKYEWQGILANSSLNATGNDMHKPWDPIFGIRITGGKAYYCSGYGEGRGAQFYFNLSQPQIRYSPHELYGTNQNTEFLATDGSHVYWAGFDPFENTKSFVYATKVSDNSIVKFPNGVSLKMSHGITYQGVTDYIDQADSRPSGIAVQTTGDYLFVSHAYLGYIKVINKTTGQVIKTLPFVKPTALVVEGNYLWLCSEGNKVKKYPVNSDGSLGNPTISLPGLVNPLDMNIHGSLLAVVDGGTSQQVKTFNIATGTADWVHGQLGGNQNSPLVANDKFLFKKTNEFGPESLEYGSIAFEDDGSFWLCDIGNYRIQHFDSNRNFIENVSYLGRTYSVYVDKNDKKKLLAGFLEFEVSYDAPARDAAVLKYNWQENGDANYENVKDITTLSNGRTYGIRTSRKNGYNEHIVEFVKEKGIRETGVLNVPFGRLYPNGSLRGMSFNEQTKTQTWLSKSLLSFDGNNNPIYSDLLNGESVILADKDPQHGSPTGSLTGEVTSSGLLISFEGSLDKKDKFRLGGIKRGKFKFRTARTTAIGYKGDFPTDGAFDIGNYQRDPVTEVPYAGYAGNLAMVSDSNIVFGYHGEFWKQSQTNKYNHFHESGLFIGQLGEVRFGVATAPAGVAGNAFTPNLVKVNNDLYLLHGDESVHAGVHKWRISDLSTVQVQIATPTQEKVTGLEGVDLLEGLVRGQSLQNGLGWERDLSADYSTSDGRFGARIGDMSYGNYKSPDLSLTYAQKSGSVTVSRNLGDNKDLTAWKLFGKVNYGGNEPNESLGNGGSFVDVLDQNSKIIARFYMERDKLSGFNFIGNGQIIAKYPENEAFGAMNSQNQPFEISALDGTITIKYTNDKSVSTKVLADPNADWKSPSKLKFHFFTKVSWQYYSRAIDIHEMRFAKTEKAVIKTPQTLAFSETPSTVYASPNVPINATASSGLPVTLKVISGPGSIAGNTLSFGEFGKVTVQASQAGNTLLEAANATIEIVNTPKAVQTIEFSNTPTKVYATPAVTITALASSGLPLSLQVLSGSGSLDGNTLSFSGYGIVKVQATQTGTDTLAAVSDTIEITNSSKAVQTIDFTNTPTKVFATSSITINAVASSGLLTSLKVLSGSGSLNGKVLSFSGFGKITIQATQAGTDTLESATATIEIINSSKAIQTIEFVNTPTKVYAAFSLTINAVASSGLPTTLKVLSGSGSINGNILSFSDGYGTVKVEATQAGNDTLDAVTATIEIINSAKAGQTIEFINTPTKVYSVNSLTITAVASSGLPLSLKVISGSGTLSGNLLSFNDGYGTVTIQATQEGNGTIEAATATIQIINSSKAAQTIAFTNTDKVYAGTPLTIAATASSGLPVSLKVISGPGSITGSTLNFSGYGTVVVQASQAGTETIEAATATIQIVNSLKAAQTIAFTNTDKVFGGTPLTISVVASSGLTVILKVVSGPGSITGSTLNFSGYGTVVVQASQAGTETIDAATSTIQIVNILKATQTIAFTNTDKVFGGSPLTITAVASSGLTVSLKVVSGPGSISGNNLNFSGYGTVIVQASQEGTGTIEAATATMQIINSSKTSQTIVFTNTNKVYGSLPLTLNAVASSGLAVSLKVISGPGSIAGNVLSFSGYGTVKVEASQAGTDKIEATSASMEIVNTAKVSQTITFTNQNQSSGGAPITLSATASSGLSVSFKILSGPGTINNNVLSFKGNGDVIVQALQAGNEIYLAATADQKITHTNSSKAKQTISFANTKTEVYGTAPVIITPVASSGLPVTLEVLSGDAYIQNNVLNFNGYGTTIIKATQPGTETIEAATATTTLVNKPNFEQQTATSGIKTYPNPITDQNYITVRLDNVPKGSYEARFINFGGQLIYKVNFIHPGGTEEHKVYFNNALYTVGIYTLQVIGSDVKFTQKILKQ